LTYKTKNLIARTRISNVLLNKKNHDIARKEGFTATDEAMLVERIGEKVKIIEGSKNNIKITTQEDLMLARQYFNLLNWAFKVRHQI